MIFRSVWRYRSMAKKTEVRTGNRSLRVTGKITEVTGIAAITWINLVRKGFRTESWATDKSREKSAR
jgi:hypothetical protein